MFRHKATGKGQHNVSMEIKDGTKKRQGKVEFCHAVKKLRKPAEIAVFGDMITIGCQLLPSPDISRPRNGQTMR
jgi:hypothetical protein